MSSYENLYNNLIKKFKYLHPNTDTLLIEKAYKLAKQAHKNQKRKSGEPYIIHPLSVATILTDLGLDIESIISGLLHDVIEDTKYSYEDIENIFGKEVALLVDGVTKLDKIEYQKEKNINNIENNNIEKLDSTKILKNEELQAENYRKMFLAMAKDIRVIVIKIADRLHNMRTLNYMDIKKQKEKAQETLDIYVPLAHRLGIAKVKYELEDLSLLYIDPEGYDYVKKKIKYHKKKRQDIVNNIMKSIKSNMENFNIKGIVEGRPKHIYSIYRKMKRKNIDIEKIYDIFAVRVIVDDVMSCYSVLGIVHDFYIPIPGRFKDYISMPKENMYQSLHTTLTSKDFDAFELQIRTWDMHKTAEYGIAAHWKYKENCFFKSVKYDNEEAKLNWLRQILEWQKELPDNQEYINELKKELSIFKDRVYCFSPKGEVISLVVGATPIDFAYSIHSSIGNQMIGARVNSKLVSFNYKLNMGDKVEIITSRNTKGPKKEWLNIVKSSHARSKINQWFRRQNKEENIIRGQELLEESARKKNVCLEEILTDERKEYLLNKYNHSDWNSFLASIGHCIIKEGQVINRLIYKEKKDSIEKEKVKILNRELLNKGKNLKSILSLDKEENLYSKYKDEVIVKGIENIFVRFSKCCNPIPGDEIIGFITKGRGVSIHRTDCKNVINITSENLNKLIEAEWRNIKSNNKVTYRTDLIISCNNKMTLIVNILNVFENYKIPVTSINTKTKNNNIVILTLSVEVKSKNNLDKLCNKILNIGGVISIDRF